VPVLKGPVLDVLKSLLQSGRSDEVVALVEKLVARNGELERRLAQILSRGHKNEGVSAAQLKLFVDALSKESEDNEGTGASELSSANEKLREASEIDKRGDDNGEVPKGKATAADAPTDSGGTSASEESHRGAGARAPLSSVWC
jgi:hypothetical protein